MSSLLQRDASGRSPDPASAITADPPAANAQQAFANRSPQQRLRAGLVGAGFIAAFHARAIRAAKGIDLVCVADASLPTARSFATEWGVSAACDSLETMLQNHALDCVHLLAPPDHHFRLAKTALEAGVHVLLEKPMCTSVAEADELVRLADERHLHLGVSHNFQFSTAYQKLRDVVKSGALGPISHLAIHHLFEMPQVRLGPFNTWMLRKPGNLIIETGPHLFSTVLDLVGQPARPSVIADRDVVLPGGRKAYRRWRMHSNVGPTGVSVEIDFGPGFPQRTISVRGLFGNAFVDFDANVCTVDRFTPNDPDFDRYSRSIRLAAESRSQARRTLTDYLLGKLKLKRRGNPFENSIVDSVASFYSAVRSSLPLDERLDAKRGRDIISYCEQTIEAAGLDPSGDAAPPSRNKPVEKPTVLVLGGSGFLGRDLVQQLLSKGYCVRAMLRGRSPALEELAGDRFEIVSGDARNQADVRAALREIDCVYHLAHAQSRTWQEYQANVIEPTRMIGELCMEAKVKRLVYTGTISSYYAGARAGTITEATPLDPHMLRRDYYSRAKAASEDILTAMHRERGLPLVIFRPGIVIGDGGNPFHWGVGRFTHNICEVWGDGKNTLPFVLVADVGAALVRGMEVAGIEGRSYNLIDQPLVTARDYLEELQRQSGVTLDVHYRPIWQFYLSDLVKWVVKAAVGHPDRIRIPSYSDWESRTQKALYDCQRTRTDLGWTPASDRERILAEGVRAPVHTWLESVR